MHSDQPGLEKSLWRTCLRPLHHQCPNHQPSAMTELELVSVLALGQQGQVGRMVRSAVQSAVDIHMTAVVNCRLPEAIVALLGALAS